MTIEKCNVFLDNITNLIHSEYETEIKTRLRDSILNKNSNQFNEYINFLNSTYIFLKIDNNHGLVVKTVDNGIELNTEIKFKDGVLINKFITIHSSEVEKYIIKEKGNIQEFSNLLKMVSDFYIDDPISLKNSLIKMCSKKSLYKKIESINSNKSFINMCFLALKLYHDFNSGTNLTKKNPDFIKAKNYETSKELTLKEIKELDKKTLSTIIGFNNSKESNLRKKYNL